MFIVFEGLDGSGKGTQISMLAKRLESEGAKLAITAEPTQFATGGLVRDALGGLTRRTQSELAGLFLADRIAHCSNPVSGIGALLKDGCTVICDRYYYSSFAYQGMDTDLKWVMDSNLNCPDIIKPDVCVFWMFRLRNATGESRQGAPRGRSLSRLKLSAAYAKSIWRCSGFCRSII